VGSLPTLTKFGNISCMSVTFVNYGRKIIEIDNIQYSYDKKSIVLTDFSLNIRRGGITAILGHNGAGKIKLLRLLGKLIAPKKAFD